jgi:hypothetical protein
MNNEKKIKKQESLEEKNDSDNDCEGRITAVEEIMFLMHE